MALTVAQKKALDNAIIEVFKEVARIATSTEINVNEDDKNRYNRFYNDGMTYSNINSLIRNKLDFAMSSPSTSISYSLGRIGHVLPIYNQYGYYKYREDGITLDNFKTTFVKKANRLYFDCKADLYYDFNTQSYNIENFLDRLVTSFPIKERNFNKALQYEWLFNYTRDISTIQTIVSSIPDEALKTMPKGLYQEIEKNHGELNYKILKEYYNYLKYGKYYKFVQSIIRYYDNDCYKYIDCFLEKYSFENLFKIMKNSLLNGELNNNPIDLIKKYYTLITNGYEVVLDTNRDLSHNMDILQDIEEKEKNEMLARQLQKLNFINDYSTDDYIIKVPQSQEDKRDEGRMQNNCVGYYYDDSILNGNNLIYFIRKKTNPNHSYITCRYNIREQATVEYRTVNNGQVQDNQALGLIKIIDEKIRAELS